MKLVLLDKVFSYKTLLNNNLGSYVGGEGRGRRTVQHDAWSWNDILKSSMAQFLNLAIPAMVGMGALYLRKRLFTSKRSRTQSREKKEMGDPD